MKQLETPRLILRGFVMEDLDDFYSYCSDPDVGIHGGREAHQDREQSAEELRKRISEDKTWAICKKESGKNIGMVWLEPDFRRKRSFERCRVLGYLLAKPEWGQGLMTEAVQEVLRYAFEELSLELVSTYRFSYNQRSGRVMEKMGFVWERTLRDATERFDSALLDVMCYSISRKEYEEWQKKNSN